MHHYLSWLRSQALSHLKSPNCRREYREFRKRHENLRDLITPGAFLCRIAHFPASPKEYERRDRLLRCLISEYQSRSSGDFPCQALTYRFYPLLINIAKRFGFYNLDQEEIDRVLYQAFLELLDKLKLETNRDVATSLKYGVRRDFRRLIEHELQWSRHTVPLPEWEGAEDEHPAIATPTHTLNELMSGRVDKEEAERENALYLKAMAIEEFLRCGEIDEVTAYLTIGVKIMGERLTRLVRNLPSKFEPIAYDAARKRIKKCAAKADAHLKHNGASLTGSLAGKSTASRSDPAASTGNREAGDENAAPAGKREK